MISIKTIINDVQKNGDKAVLRYAKRFDNDIPREISRDEKRKCYKKVSPGGVKAFREAIRNIHGFAEKQMQQYRDFEINSSSMLIGQKVVPIERIGVYVPGGNYPLCSTAIMCIVPARVAGVDEIIVCSPRITPETVVAADIAGADRIFSIGGVQAIAAMAFGTRQIPRVDKLVGPGNKYVAEAKKQLYGECGMDFIAGPSEILIIADRYANAGFIAADLLAQAEHDNDAMIILMTDSGILIDDVKKEMKRQMRDTLTRDIIKRSIKNIRVIVFRKPRDAINIVNNIAPEHVSLQVRDLKKYREGLRNYGSLFIGKYSAVAFGDYCSGTNHVLPTSSAARYTGGLSVRDFIKIQTYQYINKKGAKRLSKTAATMARIEGMRAHEKSIRIRKGDW